MATDSLLLRQAVVFASALIYWGGVLVQARRVRRKIGRSPNLRPRGVKEKLLWAGWFLVIAVWLLQPFLVRNSQAQGGLGFITPLYHPLGLVIGLAIIVAGYAATLWTYAVMGSAWRIGISPEEKSKLVTEGPFSLVRHPIYLFQIVMLTGAFLLLPTPVSLIILLIHFVCVLAKAADEEWHLEKIYGREYRDYLSGTGRLLPSWKKRWFVLGFGVLLGLTLCTALPAVKRHSEAVNCSNQMHVILFEACLDWPNEHEGVLPSDFLSMSNELIAPKLLLICPGDHAHKPATDWRTFTATNCSYEIVTKGLRKEDTNSIFLRCQVHGFVGYANDMLFDSSGRVLKPKRIW